MSAPGYATAAGNPRLGYVTDVEGNLEYFEKYVALSPVLRYSAPGQLQLVDDDCSFVFGGDLVDKGPGDLRLCRQLVDLKRRFPGRVSLLVGNRDLNKLRFTAELSAADMSLPPEAIPKPHWTDKVPSYAEHLAAAAAENGLTLAAANTRAERLRWMYKHTLGCPRTFEFRRAEMALERYGEQDGGCASERVSDEEVVENCIAEVLPGGALWEYLNEACVAALIGNTLFVHGCVDEDNYGYIPRHTRFQIPNDISRPDVERVSGVAEWVDGLNAYLKAGLQDHLARPNWDDSARQSRGGESLLALQNRCAMWGRSVVSNCYGDGGNISSATALRKRAAALAGIASARAEGGRASLRYEGVCSDPRDPVVAAWLLRSGVQRVIVGHKPCGDSPAICSSRYTGVEIVCGDTAFSDTSAPDMRGAAVASIVVVGPGEGGNYTCVHGILRDGRHYAGRCATLGHSGGNDGESTRIVAGGGPCIASSGDPCLGTVSAEGGWWTKVPLTNPVAMTAQQQQQQHQVVYVQSRGQGRSVEYRDASLVTVQQALTTAVPAAADELERRGSREGSAVEFRRPPGKRARY